MAHGFDLVQGVFHGRIAQVVEQLHTVDSEHGRQRIRRPSSPALGIITGYLLLQPRPGNQLVHPLQKEFAAGLSLLVLLFGFREGDLIHGSTESYAVDDSRIIADGRDFFRPSLGFLRRLQQTLGNLYFRPNQPFELPGSLMFYRLPGSWHLQREPGFHCYAFHPSTL